MTIKKKLTITISAAVVLIFLGIVSLITESFIPRVITHIFLEAATVPIVLYLIRKCFKEQITNAASLKKALFICGAAVALDAVFDCVRFVLSGGISTVLFLPACLPVCFMAVMYYSFEGTEKEKIELYPMLLIGIPMFALALYFEVLAFVMS